MCVCVVRRDSTCKSYQFTEVERFVWFECFRIAAVPLTTGHHSEGHLGGRG